jgi:hypothetical protein
MVRQAARLVLIAALLMVAVTVAVQAEPLSQQQQVEITSPEVSEQVRGTVPIMGSASVPNFQFYKVEYGIGPNPAQWAIIGNLHESPIINGQLEVWDTTRLPDGVYSLRLQAVKQDGNYDEFFVRQVVIANSQPTQTPTPEATETPELIVTDTPPPEATKATPEPQATVTAIVIAPTGALEQPTATPTLSRPNQQSSLPVDPGSWGQAFCFGGLAMGAVFLLMGLIFGIRRLL